MAMVRKNEYVAVDLGKLICSFMVMAIHFPGLQECGNIFYTIFVGGLCQFAVPFFFVCSGFFVANKTDSFEHTYGYVARIFILYLIYSFVNGLYIYRQYHSLSGGLLKKLIVFFRDFFLVGSFLQLWYLLAVMYAVGILFIFVHYLKLKPDTLLGLGVVIFMIGVAVNWLMGNPCGVVVIDKLVSAYSKIFATTGNGLFIGLPYVAIGYYFRVREVCCPPKYSFSLFAGTCALLIWTKLSPQESFRLDVVRSGLLMLGTAALFNFLKDVELTINLSYFAQQCRNVSTVVFGTHMIVKNAVRYLLELCGLEIDQALQYVLVIFAVVLVGNSVVILSKRFKMLNNLY